MNKITKKSLIVAATLFLISCDAKKKVDDMHKMTGEMNQNVNKTGTVACNTYIDLRQGNSYLVRKAALDSMLSIDNEFQHSRLIPGQESKSDSRFLQYKIAQAAVYMQALEFQLEKKSDDKCLPRDKSPERMQEAMGEFFRLFASFWTHDDLIELNVDPSNKEERYLNIFAFSVAMHFENINQNADDKKLHEENVMSFYDLLKLALAQESKIESGELRLEDTPVWTQEILERKNEALYLIQLRYNSFVAMALSLLSPVVAKGLTLEDINNSISLGKMAYFDINSPDFKWDANLELKSIGELHRIYRYLDAAIKARDSLVGFKISGVTPKLDQKLKLFMATMVKSDKPSNAVHVAQKYDLREKIFSLTADLANN